MTKGYKLQLLSEASIKKGTRVIVRADLDVGMNPVLALKRGAKNGKIADDFRLRAGLPTLRYLLQRGARVRIIGYLGRPQGKRDEKLTLEPIGRRLQVLLGQKVVLLRDPFRWETMHRYGQSPEILLFENIRFWPEEISNSPSHARRIARWGDCFVNDAFANSHRREASLIALPGILPSYAGLRLSQEIAALEKVMVHPKHPFVAILGGAKLETKLPLIRRFLRDADAVLIGGALANTLFALMGKKVGKSAADAQGRGTFGFLRSKKLYLPSDVVVAKALAAGAPSAIRPVEEVRADEYIVDISPLSQRRFASLLYSARTVVWNGPLGFAEAPEFAKGTIAIAKAMRKVRGFTVVGGGDTIAALSRYKLLKGFDHISTGGGAMLEFLAGKKLPAVEALKKEL